MFIIGILMYRELDDPFVVIDPEQQLLNPEKLTHYQDLLY